MTPLRTLIVDDEEPARELLRSLLAAWPELAIVGEAGDGESALRLIHDGRPELVFLDVQMPGLSGLDVLAALPPDMLPLVVFVTAYDQYALRAFEVSACDYLLKPFDEDRLRLAVRRALDRHAARDNTVIPAVQALLSQLRHSAPQPLVVKVDGRHIFLNPDEIDWIEAAGKELRVHVGRTGLTVRESMASIEERLDASLFLRVHRSAIVNRSRIRELQPAFQGEYMLILRDGTKVPTGRSYRDAVQRLLGD